MVTTTDMMTLDTAALMVADLPEVIAEWAQLPEGERASWGADWDNEMAGLERVAGLASRGRLTAAQYTQFQLIATRLTTLTADVQDIGLALPSFVLTPSH